MNDSLKKSIEAKEVESLRQSLREKEKSSKQSSPSLKNKKSKASDKSSVKTLTDKTNKEITAQKPKTKSPTKEYMITESIRSVSSIKECEWMFKIKEEGLVMDTYIVKRIDPNIINQFGGHNFDCNVKYQNGSNGRIVTKCTNGFEDNGTQFDAKDVIFRASNDKTNDWFIIYNKNNPNIWCYSFTSSTRLETNATKCEEKMGIKTPFLNSMDPLLKESIEGIFEYEEEDTIVGHRIFFNINAVPKDMFPNASHSDAQRVVLLAMDYYWNMYFCFDDYSWLFRALLMENCIDCIVEEYVEWKCPYCPHEGTIDWKRPIGDERYAPPPAPAPASPHTTETNDYGTESGSKFSTGTDAAQKTRKCLRKSLMSLNAIQCQKYCDLLQTNGKYDGIQVFFSDILNGNVMYKNGKQWKFGIENRNITMEKELTLGNDHYNTAIINRFGVDGYDCDVKYQPGSNATIMTNCSDGSEDKTSQYDPKAKENEVLRKTLTEKQSSKQSKALLKTPQSRLTDKSSVKTSVVEPKRGTATQKPNTKSPTKDNCKYIKTNDKYDGIDVYYSTVHKKYFMYNKGYEWKISFGNKDFDTKFEGNNYDRNIIKRFSGNGLDCYVKYQSGNTGDIVTECVVTTDGKTYNIDTDSQYNPKDLIFRATNKRDDNWLIVYNKNVANISCYSPNERPKDRLVKNATKCLANVNQNKLFVDSMNPLLRKNIEAVVDFGVENKIFLHFIFFNINGKPMYCSQSLGGSECNSSLKYLLPECFPPPPTETPKGSNTGLIITLIVVIVVIVVVIAVYFIWQRVKTDRMIEAKRRAVKELTWIDLAKREIGSRRHNRRANIAEIERHLDEFAEGAHPPDDLTTIIGDRTALRESVEFLDSAHFHWHNEFNRLARVHGYKNAEVAQQAVDDRQPADCWKRLCGGRARFVPTMAPMLPLSGSGRDPPATKFMLPHRRNRRYSRRRPKNRTLPKTQSLKGNK
ncbi:unnamed protein product [Medioppia subpectinata]|uniref:Uncharacterized protein n=1 Tax=Medioppia subpectinata TaxID=1979941 RepID=A0A7R9PVW1_9ACAR|nr:unnamed protein product [Medioppia subpectinata]CAG2103269.1 unnamed protein product [Medioppia subpectinata]